MYVGRPSPLGNPYALGKDGTREEVIEKYRLWLSARIKERDPVVCTALLGILPDHPLSCHCASKPCHAEAIAELLDKGIQEQLRSRKERTMRYAGIGSRSTPEPILRRMTSIAGRLSALGYTLLSGGAAGADTAFEAGAGKKAIFLPWPGFRGHQGPFDCPDAEAFRVAAVVHPSWDKIKRDSAKSLLARNSHQVLGADLRSPVDFVLCWTPDGCETESSRSWHTGGTGQAIILADRWGIPVINLALENAIVRLKAILED